MPDPKTLTDEQKESILRAARQVWDEIGYDVIEANDGRTVSRAEVIETVLDADRLASMLRRNRADAATVAIAQDYSRENTTQLESLLKTTFKHARYGL